MKQGRVCDWCLAEPCDPDYEEIIGFTRRRNGGGANQIIQRRPTGRYIGPECLLKLRRGELAGEQPLALPGVA